MLARLRAWWRRGGRPQTRLTPEQAQAIANAAMTGDWSCYAGKMGAVSMERRDGRVLWQVGSATIGSGATVTVDDATGAVLDRRGWGVR